MNAQRPPFNHEPPLADVTLTEQDVAGAIAGVLAAYLVLFPWARVRTIIFIFIFFTIVTLPAIILIGLWFLLQFFDGRQLVGFQSS